MTVPLAVAALGIALALVLALMTIFFFRCLVVSLKDDIAALREDLPRKLALCVRDRAALMIYPANKSDFELDRILGVASNEFHKLADEIERTFKVTQRGT